MSETAPSESVPTITPVGHFPQVATLGEVMALLLAQPGQLLETATTFDLTFAGAEATVAVGLSRLGRSTAYVGRVGDDALGRRVTRELRGYGVDVSALRSTAERPTGVLVRDTAVDRPLTVHYARALSAGSTLCPDDVPVDTIRGARLLHLSGITAALSEDARSACEHAAAVARDAGVPVSFDPNVRLLLADRSTWREIIESLADTADIVLTGVDDARVVTDDPARWFIDRGAKIAVVKDGVRGAQEIGADRTSVWQPALPSTLVDPVGAGDAFDAGWIHAFLEGHDAVRRLRCGAAVAALSVGARGDVAGLPNATTLAAALGGASDVER